MPKKISKFAKVFTPFGFFASIQIIYAQILPDIPQAPITNIRDIGGAAGRPLEKLVVWFIGIFWIIAVAMIIWAAFLYLTAGGSEDKIKEAKARLLYAVIAAAIALLATGIDIIAELLLTGGIT